MEQRKQGRGWHGHFLCFRARINCESIPVVPASLVRTNLNDPRGIPYLLIWKDERDGEVKEAVRLGRCRPTGLDGFVELKRPDGRAAVLRLVWRMLPRNGGRALLLLCPGCHTPRRFVYGWEWESFSGRSNVVRRTDWKCRSCNQLRYSSEGGHLLLRGGPISRLLGLHCPDISSPRPEPWYPLVFSNPNEAAGVGFGPVT